MFVCFAGCCAAAEAVRVWRVWSEDGTVCAFHSESTAACQLQSEIPTACWLQSECTCHENLMLKNIWSQCINPEVALADTQHMKPHLTVPAECNSMPAMCTLQSWHRASITLVFWPNCTCTTSFQVLEVAHALNAFLAKSDF